MQLLDRDRELCKKVAVDVEMTLVLSEIAKLMSFAQNARNLRAEPERVGHSLKHNVAIVRTISVPPQSSESERVSGILRQRKSALGASVSWRASAMLVRPAVTNPSNSLWAQDSD